MPKRAINLSIDADIVAEAKERGANLSAAAEAGIRAELSLLRRREWIEENRAAIEANNAELARNGLRYEPDWITTLDDEAERA